MVSILKQLQLSRPVSYYRDYVFRAETCKRQREIRVQFYNIGIFAELTEFTIPKVLSKEVVERSITYLFFISVFIV